MISVAIVDDEAEERQRIRSCLDYVTQQRGIVFCADEFATAEEFLVKYDFSYDIVFMDILFGKRQDGMRAARKLRETDKTVALVFITNLARMALKGYEVDALDFILKPVDKYAFLLKLDRILGRIENRGNEQITVAPKGELYRIRKKLILYLLVRGHYVEYHSREGVFSEYITLAAAEKKLNDPSFVRCDRGCLVNLRFVTQIGKEFCVVDGEMLPIARTQRGEFQRAFADYLNGQAGARGGAANAEQ